MLYESWQMRVSVRIGEEAFQSRDRSVNACATVYKPRAQDSSSEFLGFVQRFTISDTKS